MKTYFKDLFFPELPENLQAELALAKMRALRQQVPLLYVMASISVVVLGLTHVELVHPLFSIGVPFVFCVIGAWRSIHLFRKYGQTSDPARAKECLSVTTRSAAVLGFLMAVWALALHRAGDAHSQGHVALFLGVTVVGCIACLMHVRRAALAIALCSMVPTFIYFSMSGRADLAAVSINIAMVVIVMMFVTSIYSRDFAQMVAQRMAVQAQQDDTQRLSDANLRLANSDSLTALPNRRRFFEKLDECLMHSAEAKTRFAVGILDLDGFKPVNDICGHAVGDRLLVAVASRLRHAVGEKVVLARLGGDEFGLLFIGCGSEACLMEKCESLTQLIKAPFNIDGVVARISGSMGVACFPDAGRDAEQLFERADYALYHAKDNFAGGVVLFTQQHEAQIREVSGVEMRMRDADLDEELSLVFQPIVEIGGGQATGFEVLSRWHSPVLGSVSPTTFIRAAEKVGVINDLTRMVFRKTLAVMNDWPEQVYVSFNLSSLDISAPALIDDLIELMERSNIAPSRVTFEVTETAVMLDFDRACESLNKLKVTGAKVALDDFGTGYSSLSYLRNLPLDRLKIDRSFITEIEDDDNARAVMRSVVEMCKSLKLECIVEGVETEGQLSILQAMGCTKIQGYYFSRPMETGAVSRYLAAEERRRDVG